MRRAWLHHDPQGQHAARTDHPRLAENAGRTRITLRALKTGGHFVGRHTGIPIGGARNGRGTPVVGQPRAGLQSHGASLAHVFQRSRPVQRGRERQDAFVGAKAHRPSHRAVPRRGRPQVSRPSRPQDVRLGRRRALNQRAELLDSHRLALHLLRTPHRRAVPDVLFVPGREPRPRHVLQAHRLAQAGNSGRPGRRARAAPLLQRVQRLRQRAQQRHQVSAQLARLHGDGRRVVEGQNLPHHIHATDVVVVGRLREDVGQQPDVYAQRLRHARALLAHVADEHQNHLHGEGRAEHGRLVDCVHDHRLAHVARVQEAQLLEHEEQHVAHEPRRDGLVRLRDALAQQQQQRVLVRLGRSLHFHEVEDRADCEVLLQPRESQHRARGGALRVGFSIH
ncbi:AraC family transcriptional regulator [Babesia caballi]|uniref:AraC family transcriptional regulator n=1 Tax=Babesia caballi TaxID=5871 RepID=A0AAV4LXZ3_BABCB|nr:AraC family transcriptional regulator [Babesia caballi]